MSSQPLKRTWLKRTLWTVFSTILIFIAVLVGLLNSSLGTFVLSKTIERVDAIQIEEIQGTIFDELVLSSLTIEHTAVSGSIEHVSLRVSLDCLWQKALCIAPLRLSQISLQLQNHTNIALDNAEAELTLHNETGWQMAPSQLRIGSLNVFLPLEDDIPSIASTSTSTAVDAQDQPIPQRIQNALHQLRVSVNTYQSQLDAWRTLEYDPKAIQDALPELHLPIIIDAFALNIERLQISNQNNQILPISKLRLVADVNDGVSIEQFFLSNKQWQAQANGFVKSDYAHQIELSLDNIHPLLNTLAFNSEGNLLNPQIYLRTTGIANFETNIALDLTQSQLPIQIKSEWEALQYIDNGISMALAPGQLYITGDRQNASAKINLNIPSLAVNKRLKVNNVGVACQLTLGQTRLDSQDCTVTLADVLLPISIGISAGEEFGFDLRTNIAVTKDAKFWDWKVDDQALSGFLQPFALDAYNASLQISEKQLTIRHAITGNFVQPLTMDQQVELLLDNETLTLSLPKLNIRFGEERLSFKSWDVELTEQALQLSPLELHFFTKENPEPVIVEMNIDDFALNNPTFNANLTLEKSELSPLFDLASRFLETPIPITTDAAISLFAKVNFTDSILLADTQVALTQSDWLLEERIALNISEATLGGDIQWDTRLPIPNLTAKTRGNIKGQNLGDIGIELDYLEQLAVYAQLTSVNLDLFADLLPLFEAFGGVASANIALRQVENDFNINGVVIVPELNLALAELPESHIKAHPDIVFAKQPPQIFEQTVQTQQGLPFGIVLDINAIIDPLRQQKVKLSAFDFSTALDGALNISMRDNNLNVVGDLNLRDGTYQAYGQDLLVRRGVLNFTGPASLPFISLEAIRNPQTMNEDVIAGLRVEGLTDNLRAELFSEPEFENPNILSYLLRGKGLDATTDENSSVILTNALLGFGLGQSESGLSRLGTSLGVEDLQLSTQGAGEQTQIGISGKLNDRLSVEYRVGIFEDLAEFGLRYELQPELFIEAISGANNALDIFYQMSWGERIPETTKEN